MPTEFRLALAEARERTGLSQTAAAKLVGAALRTWQQWEAGDRAMPLTAAELWCIAAVALGHLPACDALVALMVRPQILARLVASASLPA